MDSAASRFWWLRIATTAEYSNRPQNTNPMHTDNHTFKATTYDTLGSDAWYCFVMMVNKEVTPSVTLPGTASTGNQNVIKDINTMSTVGI